MTETSTELWLKAVNCDPSILDIIFTNEFLPEVHILYFSFILSLTLPVLGLMRNGSSDHSLGELVNIFSWRSMFALILSTLAIHTGLQPLWTAISASHC